MDITLELHCDQCGSANLTMPETDEEEAAIACNDCGEAHGTFGALKGELIACALAHSSQVQRKALDNLP
jgi:DNA-directed RNA polymerase subunit RPC12/RpoP